MIMRNTKKNVVPTIDIKALYPGDILLTTEASLTSWLIRKATRSQYSHVILHVGYGILIDSTPKDGIFYSKLKLVKAEHVDKHAYRILATIPKAIRIHVYRHKSLAPPQQQMGNGQQHTMMADMNRVLSDKWGKDYSLLEALGMATSWLNWAPKFKRFVLQGVGRLGADKGKVVPSEFCSQFVANALADLKMPAFSACRSGEVPSPQSFAEPDSNMVRIKDCETCSDPLMPGDLEKIEQEKQTLDMNVASQFNLYRQAQQRKLATLDDINSITRRIIADTQNRLDGRG